VQFTIVRLRMLVVSAGVLLLLALVALMTLSRWKNPFKHIDIPPQLGINIQAEANGFTYTQSSGGRTLFKIHASKVIQLKQGNAQLHDVKIELYGTDGSRVDRIEGSDFEYDQKKGTATAAGAVEITLMRPGVAPAIAPKAIAGQATGSKANPLASAAQAAEQGEIHVKTSGLTFDQKSGSATTAQALNFSMAQGTGSAIGATYNSAVGTLVLDRAVELQTQRGAQPVNLHAMHAEFVRDDQICRLRAATTEFQGGTASAGDATVYFRNDGTAKRLDAVNGFTMTTVAGSHLEAPKGTLDFNEKNQPRRGHLEGGVSMDSASDSASRHRQLHGSSPTAELEFDAKGELRKTHLERGVELHSEEVRDTKGGPLRNSRTWRSPVADVEFRTSTESKMEPQTIHGTGGVVVTGESQLGKGAVQPSRMAADDLTGTFGPGSQLTTMMGVGHTSIDETNAKGIRQTSSGDRLEAHFVAATATNSAKSSGGTENTSQIQSASIEGNVVLVQIPTPKQGAAAATPMRATAGRADYAGVGEWLHLTLNPRVEDGGKSLTADKIDVSQATGDAFAHGNVKASFLAANAGKTANPTSPQEPAHVIAAEAEMRHATGEATFRGQARLWQQANSIAAPTIVLDRANHTLVAHSTDAAEPVRVVLLSASDATHTKDAGKKSTVPSVIRVRGGDLKYSDLDRKALMRAGSLGAVIAETDTATTSSDQVELLLKPADDHAEKNNAASPVGGEVDRLTAKGHVVVSSQDRRGTGEQLVYTSQTEEYVMTGTATAQPRITDPTRGTVTGEALIFHGRDESVSIEGGKRKTTTETTAPKR